MFVCKNKTDPEAEKIAYDTILDMAIDWTKLYKNYKGFWVTLKDDEVTVISKAKTPQEALKLAEKKGYSDPYITRVPEEVVSYVG